MSEPGPAGSNSRRPRGSYSRLICLGCRERRIRCELPSEIELPNPGELRTVQTPCYRCKRLGIPCVVRQTILGRPSLENSVTTVADSGRATTGDTVSRVIIQLPSRAATQTRPATVRDETQLVDSTIASQTKPLSSIDLALSKGDSARCRGDGLLVHQPQSTDTVIIIRAVDTIRCEDVEEAWPRHLAVRVGHTPALDLSIKAIVAACAYARGVPRLSPGDCYQALALALSAVQANIKKSHGRPNDDILASTALLAPFDGVMKKHDIPTRLHVEGLAAILAARPATHPVTPLARDILDFYACDSAIMASIHGMPSPFENIAPAYFANDRVGSSDGDRAQLKALANELFIRIPRLVGLLRSLRSGQPLQDQLMLDALGLSTSLLEIQDFQAEERLLRKVQLDPSTDCNAPAPLHQTLHFASVQDFEALLCYWLSRLFLLRLIWCLHDLSMSHDIPAYGADECRVFGWPILTASAPNEMSRLVQNILMCSEYARTLHLRKRRRLFAHAMVVVWGVTRDDPEVLKYVQVRKGTGTFSDLLLRTSNVTLVAKPNLTMDDMDAAADVLAGGPPKGRFAELYGR